MNFHSGPVYVGLGLLAVVGMLGVLSLAGAPMLRLLSRWPRTGRPQLLLSDFAGMFVIVGVCASAVWKLFPPGDKVDAAIYVTATLVVPWSGGGTSHAACPA